MSIQGSANRLPSGILAGLLLTGVALLHVFFQSANVYLGHFFAIDAPLALAYNVARMGLAAALFFGCVGVGDVIRKPLAGAVPLATRTARLDRLILDFFLGASVLGTFWYAAGLFGLLKPWLATGVQALALATCAPRFVEAWTDLRACGKGEGIEAPGSDVVSTPRDRLARALLGLLAIVAVSSVAANFVFNAIVPGGNHDMYHHYFPFLLQALERGNTLPNDVWYQFYYTKTQGLFFASSLISDPLAPQLVSGIFVIAVSLCVYALLRMPLLPRHFALLGVAAFNLAFITRAWWGTYQKNHIVMLGFFGWLLWFCTRLWQNHGAGASRGLAWLAGLVACAFILNAPPAFSIALPFAGCMFLLALLMRRPGNVAWNTFAICVGLCLGLGATFAVNYSLTGLAEHTPFRLFWVHADLERMSNWFSPYLMVALEQGSSKELGGLAAPATKMLGKAGYYLGTFKVQSIAGLIPGGSVDLALALCAFACLCAAAALARQGDPILARLARAQGAMAVPSIVLVVVTVAVGIITRQGESYERFTAFGLIPAVLLFVLLWQYLLSRTFFRQAWGQVAVGVVCLALIVACGLEAAAPARVPVTDRDVSLRFFTGKASVADVYTELKAMWPPMLEAQAALPQGTRIRVMHNGYHCMAPGAPMETEFSFSLGREWHTAVLEQAETAKAYLQAQGLNYFLVDADSRIFDLLAYSPLFSEQSLQINFKVAWRKDNTFLLTWADEGPVAAPSKDMRDFLALWPDCKIRANVKYGLATLHARITAIYEFNGRNPLKVALPPGLAPLKGFQ